MKREELAKKFDHTLLKANMTRDNVETLCQEALDYRFKSVCVPACYIDLCKKLLKDHVLVASVASFPFGYNTTEQKLSEVNHLLDLGVDEVDMVASITHIKNQDWSYVEQEIYKIKQSTCHKTLKVIVETALLSENELIMAINCCVNAGADYIKTSTGYSSRGATIEDIKTMKKYSNSLLKIKASGGINTLQQVQELLSAGANRIGSSSSVKILNEYL